jgi:hypothetical protein
MSLEGCVMRHMNGDHEVIWISEKMRYIMAKF